MKKNDNRQPLSILTTRQFHFGSLSIAISIIFIALIFVVNILASILTSRFPLTIDLTPDSKFKLSDESIEFVKGVDKPVDITVFASEQELANSGDMALTQFKIMADQLSQYNSRIGISYVDLVKNPAFTSNFPDLELSYYDILFVCGENSRVVSLNDMFNISYNQQTYQPYVQSSKADEMLLTALMGVTSDDKVKVGLLTGHEEADSSSLKELLDKNNFEVVEQSLIGENPIDPDIEILFMLAPKRDPDAELLKKLDTFLENGQQYGKTLFYAANTDQPPTPNLDAFLADWGIQVGDGAVFETNRNNILSLTSAYYCTVEYSSEDYTKGISTSMRIGMPYGRPLNTLFDAQSGYQTTELLSYSPTSCIYPANAPEDWQPTEADLTKVPALIRSSFTKYDGMTPLQSNVFAVSSALTFDKSALSSGSMNNSNYYMGLLNTVTEREDVITVAPKDMISTQLGINQAQVIVISIILVFVVPICIIIAGIVIWLSRRYK